MGGGRRGVGGGRYSVWWVGGLEGGVVDGSVWRERRPHAGCQGPIVLGTALQAPIVSRRLCSQRHAAEGDLSADCAAGIYGVT